MSMCPKWPVHWRPLSADSNTPPTFTRERPLTPRAVWWAIALTVPLIVTLAGAGIILWAVSSDPKSLSTLSLGVTLVFVGLGGIVAWVASGGHRSPESER